MTPDDGRVSTYDELGADYAEHSAANSFNALYDRPAILSMAGEIAGKRVLDAGCAAGHLSAQLAGRGATVTGVDLSRELIGLATGRFGAQARFECADLAEPLSFAADGEFDLITASLVLHYLRDWGPTLAEFRRVLRPGGRLVFSVHHPEDWHWFGRPDYFRTELIVDEWEVGGRTREVEFYRRPLSATFAAVRAAGFWVDELAEPMPLPRCRSVDPRAYELLSTTPRFLYLRAISPE